MSSSTHAVAACSSARQDRSSHSSDWHWDAAVLASVGCVAALTPGDVHMEKKTEKGNNKALSFREAADYLKQNLAPIRDKLIKSGHPAPYLTIKEDKNPPDKGRARTMHITLELASLYGLGAWMAMLQAPIFLTAEDPPLPSAKATKDSCEFSDRSKSTVVYMENHPYPRLTVSRDGGFRQADLDILLSSYEGICVRAQSGPGFGNDFGSFKMVPFAAMFDADKTDKSFQFPGGKEAAPPAPSSPEQFIADLTKLGIKVIPPDERDATQQWQQLAGYEFIKEEITDTVLNYLLHPDVYDAITLGTRQKSESNRPRAILFEGPPGTGKTMTARIIAGSCKKHMIHLPIESIVSKWYGESEKSLTKILDICEKLGGCVIFIDEIDAMAPSRGGEIHEATRRILSVLLQRLEGFSGRSDNILVCATNRKRDLDQALISRFNVIVKYDLPNAATRAAIFKMYAKQLTPLECDELSDLSEGLSGRGIKDVCEQTERKFASVLIRDRLLRTPSDAVDREHPLPRYQCYVEQIHRYAMSHGVSGGENTHVAS